MAQNTELERKVINRFVTKSKRERYLQFVTSTKNRKKFIKALHSGQFFLASALEHVTGIEKNVIQQSLVQSGITAHTCYVISENAAIDTHILALGDALRQVVGWGAGTILVFGEADLIYVELDGLRNRYINQTRLVA
jgi:hypothetical protein